MNRRTGWEIDAQSWLWDVCPTSENVPTVEIDVPKQKRVINVSGYSACISVEG
jgi:hypothetical protein